MNPQYKALTYINLPLLDIKKAPGDTITDEEFIAGGQDEEHVQDLINQGALSTDMDAALAPDNEPVPVPPPYNQGTTAVVDDDIGKGVNIDE
jgi:hypothetical protein